MPRIHDIDMRYEGLDLNLLVALDALLAQRNLTKAARLVNLSQPAMSAAVARLRDYFCDDLFVMRGREFVLTARARELATPVREALSHIRHSILSPAIFNPLQSDRRFRVCMSDFMMLIYFSNIVKRVAREAPSISFELLLLDDDPTELLRRGEPDFLILPELFMADKQPRELLFEETLVCVACATNKQVPPQLTLDEYFSMGHVSVRFGHWRRPSLEDLFLPDRGVSRCVELVVPAFSMVPPMIAGTKRIATIPSRLAKYFAKHVPLQIIEAPLPLFAFNEAVQWPAHRTMDPAHVWMRNLLLDEGRNCIA